LVAAICRWCGSIRKDPLIVYSGERRLLEIDRCGKNGRLAGAPGGDDSQNVWINPNNHDIIFLGPTGRDRHRERRARLESWYKQSTRALYYVRRTTRFRIAFTAATGSGSVGIQSRGDRARSVSRLATGAAEDMVMSCRSARSGHCDRGKLTRFDRAPARGKNILPVPVQTEDFRMLRTSRNFSPKDPRLLFFMRNTLGNGDPRDTGKRSARTSRERNTSCQRRLENTKRTQSSRRTGAE